MPRLSVIVPTYDHQEHLESCLLAIRASAYRDFELIVVDDGNAGGILEPARRHADTVVRHASNRGPSEARNTGAAAASGEILVYIDSDILIRPDSLAQIAAYFDGHPGVDALTGKLAKEHSNPDFFSQYKNLYMHFIFRRLPERVDFVFGSICAVRRDKAIPYGKLRAAEDTAMGASLSLRGAEIAFLRTLEVEHLKKYDFLSWVKNDFCVPCDWAQIFWRQSGWKFLGKGGYLHSPPEQLASVALAPLTLLAAAGAAAFDGAGPAAALAILWTLLNLEFLRFLAAERGAPFAAAALTVTFLDHCVMSLGIAAGSVKSLITLD